VANEAFARVRIDQLLKDADWSLSDGRSVGFESLCDGGGEAGRSPYSCRDNAFATLQTSRTNVNPGAGGTQKARYAYA
jgi:type I restriction enzyme R subunit